MGYFTLSKSVTTAALDASEVLLLLFGLILTIGALGEYKKLPRLLKASHATFELLVVIGIAGELFADGGVFVFSRHLQTISDGEFAALNQEAGNARKDAGVAIKEAAMLRKQAEDEAMARVKLERELGPRLLSQEQQNRIAGKLRRFAGMTVLILIFGGDTKAERAEADGLAISIWAALKRAGIESVASSTGFQWPIQGIWITGCCAEMEQPKIEVSSAPSQQELAAFRRQGELQATIDMALSDEHFEVYTLIPPEVPNTGFSTLPETRSSRQWISPPDARIIIGKRPPTILRR